MEYVQASYRVRSDAKKPALTSDVQARGLPSSPSSLDTVTWRSLPAHLRFEGLEIVFEIEKLTILHQERALRIEE